MSFRSPPSRMKVTSRRTTYPSMNMIQRWKREKSAGNQTALQVHFLFVFQEISNDEFCHMDCVPSNPSVQLVDTCTKINISKTQHDPTVDFGDMAIGALLVLLQNLQLSLSAFLYFFFFFFLTGGLCSFIGTFFHNNNFVPHSCLYVFYFIFHVNYLVYFCLNRQSLPNSDWDEIFNQGTKTY